MFDDLDVCFDITAFFDDLADKNLQKLANPNSGDYSAQSTRISSKFKILVDGYRKMFDQSFSNSKDLGDMLKFLPGVVVQKRLSMQGMVDLYGIKPDLMERLIKSIFERRHPLIPTTNWMTLCLVSCRTETIFLAVTAIPCFNIFPFAVISCPYWMNPMPLTFNRKFSFKFVLSFS